MRGTRSLNCAALPQRQSLVDCGDGAQERGIQHGRRGDSRPPPLWGPGASGIVAYERGRRTSVLRQCMRRCLPRLRECGGAMPCRGNRRLAEDRLSFERSALWLRQRRRFQPPSPIQSRLEIDPARQHRHNILILLVESAVEVSGIAIYLANPGLDLKRPQMAAGH